MIKDSHQYRQTYQVRKPYITKGKLHHSVAGLCLSLLVASPVHSKTVQESNTPAKDSAPIAKTENNIKPATKSQKDVTNTLKPYTAELKASIKGLPMTASGNRVLKKNSSGEWELNFVADAGLFGISESSQFQFNDGYIKPGSYRLKRSGLIGNKPEEKALFDWQQAQVNWKKEDKQWAIKLQNGALDNLSYQTQLRMDLVAGKKDLNYLIADDDELYQRRFTIEGEEILNTDAGKLHTVKVKVDRDNNKRETYIWFAKDWDYFFVKLLQKEGGSEYTVEIKSASIDGKPIKGI